MTPLGQEDHKQTEKDPEGNVLRIMRKKGEKEVNFLSIKIKGRSHQDHPILATEERFLVFVGERESHGIPYSVNLYQLLSWPVIFGLLSDCRFY